MCEIQMIGTVSKTGKPINTQTNISALSQRLSSSKQLIKYFMYNISMTLFTASFCARRNIDRIEELYEVAE